MNTDTPETDAETWKAGDLRIGSKVCADFARKLERERDELKRWTSVNGVIDLQRERDEAREETIRTREFMDYGFAKAQEELAAVTAQRDGMEEKLRIELRGHPDSELWGDAGLIAATMRCVDALDVVTAQRDMLAEALRKVARSWNYAEVAQQALQSLTHKP
jgi:hypothetical protein